MKALHWHARAAHHLNVMPAQQRPGRVLLRCGRRQAGTQWDCRPRIPGQAPA